MTSPLTRAPSLRRGRAARLSLVLALAALVSASFAPTQSVGAGRHRTGAAKPTVVLVHGAWADASNWAGVVTRLQHDGYEVFAIANPLRTHIGIIAQIFQYETARLGSPRQPAGPRSGKGRRPYSP